jgi:NAD(P)-dependent dehydrogenase (short-subunit alcohol dehydrogenase family)/3-oxoacyl-(acyl-carrier-protein) synthase
MGELDGKLALVTGGARNIGKAIARELAARGAHVIVNFFHALDEAKRTRAELEEAGARVDLIRASVARPDQVTRMFAEIEQRFGHLDILVNNAASGALLPLDEVTDEHLDRGFDTNLKGALRCARHAVPLMVRRGGGTIVNISALGGSQFVMANYLACAPAKAAMEALTRYLAAEYASQNIRVNTASAAMLVSEVADSFPRAAEMQRAVRRATPMGRLGTPEEFADVVGFLAGDQSRWITGQVVLADGGLSLGVPLLAPPPGSPDVPVAPVPDPAVRSDSDPAVRPVPVTVDETEPDTVAVVGMGMAVAGANSPEEFWDLRLSGAQLFIPVPGDRWDRARFHATDPDAEDKSYQDRCVFITDFTPVAGVVTAEDTVQRHEFTTLWLRHSLVQAMREVTIRPDDRFSCVIGYTPDGNQHLEEAGVLAAVQDRAERIIADLDAPEPTRAALFAEVRDTLRARYRHGAHHDPSRFLPHRVGALAMAGILPSETTLRMVDTACSSSLYAVDIGSKALLDGDVDVAVCGGAFALGPRGTVLFSKLHGLSKQGEVRALDAAADGVIFADGAAVLILKRLSRARADGDRVLGLIRAVGTSSDGKGKAVYAPNPDGQARAIARAGAGAGPVDLIIAHATGTPAGDLAEFTTLRERYGAHPVAVTSNKSLIGHTGWAAGVVSIIEVLLGFRHGTIAPQFRFTGPPEDFRITESKLHIPTRALRWPVREDRLRTAAVSGFGFGGTNAHLLVTEPPRATRSEPHHPPPDSRPTTPRPAPPAGSRDDPHGKPPAGARMAIVGWAAHLPGLSDRESVRKWLLGTGGHPESSFGEVYPTPGFDRVRLPPRTVRTIDRCQLMALECGHQLREQLGDAWAAHADRTGVFIGHLGPTRAGMLYANRCYLDDIADTLRSNPRLADVESLPEFLNRLREDARRLVPAANEDSFPGMMPNVISARVANYFGLNGPNLTTDAGLGSTLAAFDVAGRYLRAGDIDVALVGGINGNTLPELRALLRDDLPGVDPAEGAFLFAVVAERLAARAGLAILGWIPDDGPDTPRPEARQPYPVDCGPADPDTARYLGGAGGLAVLRAVLTRTGSVEVGCGGAATPPVRIDLPVTTRDVDRRFTDPAEYAPGCPVQVRRHVPELVPEPASRTGPAQPFLPDGVVLLTDRPDIVAALGPLPPDVRVLSCSPVDPPREGWHHLPTVTPDAVDAALAGRPPRHLRLLADLTASAPPTECVTAGAPELEALHDLTFLALQRCGDAPVTAVLLGALPDGAPHPYLGLFSGLLKTAHLESPDSGRFLLAAATRDVTTAVRAAERETGNRRTLPVVFDVAGQRRVYRLTEQPVELDPDTPARLSEDSVVLAVGGARGITAELMKALAQQFRPKLYVIGSNPLDRYPDQVFAGSDAEFAAGRRSYLRAQLAARPGTPVAALNREYDRMADARAARRNLDVMAAHCGPDRVRYLTCDVTDPEAVRQVVDTVLASEPGIDLLVNAAGRNGSALIPDKDFATFRAVRDLKLRSHRNLKLALADRPPKLWCGFGSLLGFFGQRGEADYASGNDFLATAAMYASQVEAADEVTIGWTLWSGVGMGANELVSRYYDRKGFYTPMAAGEGVHHFVRELHAPGRTPYLVHLGEAERRTVESFYPGFFGGPAAAEREAGPDGFYLRRKTGGSSDAASFQCRFELSTDGYLRHHMVRGHPTLPGMFMTEVAAEAAVVLRPGWHPVGFTDLRFERFLRLYGEQPATKHIHARVVDQTPDLVTVEVRLATDVVAPNGTVLARDRTHFSARVLLARQFPAAPRWQPWQPDPAEVAVPDPYHHPDAPVVLTGPFLTTTATRLHPRGKRARYAPRGLADDPTWSRFRVPALLLDGMARTGVLNLVDGHRVPVAAPVSVRRIDLYQDANDLTLAVRGPVELYATPAEFALTGDATPGNRFVAVGPDGRVVAQIKDITATVLGHLDLDTDRFDAPDDLVAVRETVAR